MEVLMYSSQSHIRFGTMTIQPILLTLHAEVRQQQRGIRHDVLDCLLAYGRREHDHSHCEIVYFDARAAERAHKEVGPQLAHLVSDNRDVYAVIDSDGCVITTGHRFRRILRDKSQSNLRPSRARGPSRPSRLSRPRPPFVDLLSAAV
jgi:hypothetical protein